jgi:hypothetical protein
MNSHSFTSLEQKDTKKIKKLEAQIPYYGE